MAIIAHTMKAFVDNEDWSDHTSAVRWTNSHVRFTLVHDPEFTDRVKQNSGELVPVRIESDSGTLLVDTVGRYYFSDAVYEADVNSSPAVVTLQLFIWTLDDDEDDE